MDSLRFLFKRAKRIHQTEGLKVLVSRTFVFVLSRFFVYETYYLTERNLQETRSDNEADFAPQIGDFILRVVTSNREADELEADGYDFRSYPHFIDGRIALDKGAIAFCIFIGRELASIGWIAMTQQAMDALNEPPIKLDLTKGESFNGSVWTHPKYRRMGFRTYRSFKMRQFLSDRGFVRILGYTTEKDYAAAVRIATAVGRTVYARGRYLKILRWKSWKEKPLTRTC